jgi:peroxiredoxin
MVSTFSLLVALAISGPPEPAQIKARVVSKFDLADASSTKHSAKEWGNARAIVLFFVWTECPASNSYAPEMARLAKAYGGKDVLFYGVHSDPDLTPEQASQHASEHRLPFPMLLDPTQQLAHATGVKRQPAAAILSPDGKVLYAGRIDDRYVSLGKKRVEPTQRDTQDALDAILAGKKPAVAETEVIGCLLPKIIENPKPKSR